MKSMLQRFLVPLAVVGVSVACTESTSVTLKAKRIAARFVDAQPPQHADFEQSIEFTGAIEPRQFVNLNFAVPGRIVSCRLKEGQNVKQDEEICRLDESIVRLEVKRAEDAYKAATRVNATQFVDKQRKLFEAGVIGQAEFEQLRIQSESSKATQEDTHSLYELALKKQSEHVLRSPWAGTVTKLLMRPGQLTAPEVPVAIVSGHEGLQLKVELPASVFASIQIGNKASLTSASVQLLADTAREWFVAEKAMSVNPQTQTFSVIFSSKQQTKLLAPGMLVSGLVQSRSVANTLVVPQSSLYTIDAKGQAQLFVVEEGQLKLRQIDIGLTNGKQAQVLGGLSQTDLVVSKIAPDFIDGMKVEVAK